MIVVDDLDRCDPEQCVEILEGISFLASTGKCFVLLGMSREQVHCAVGMKYGNLAVELERGRRVREGRQGRGDSLSARAELAAREEYSREYLEKIIDMYVSVANAEV